MENKNKRFYLPMALLAVAVVAGVSFSSLRNSGSANLIAQTSTGGGSGSSTTYNCDDIRVKLNSSTGYTSAEKLWYDQKCTTSTTPSSTGSGSDSSTGTGSGSDSTTSSGTGDGSGTMAPPSTTGTDNGSGSSTSDTTRTTTPSTTPAPTTPTTTPTYTCEGAYKDLNTTTGNYTYDEKLWYRQYCGPTPTTLPVTPTASQPNDPCVTLKNMMARYDATSSDYSEIQSKFNDLCSSPTTTTTTSPATTPNGTGTTVQPAQGFEEKVITAPINQQDTPFKDTNTADLSGKAAFELYIRGVIGGRPDGTFDGTGLVNRAEAAKFLLLARYGINNFANVSTTTTASVTFRDTLKGSWYEKFINAASQRGIIKGYSDGTYRPALTVNTAEFLKMMTLTFGLETNLPYTYSDVKSTDWFAIYAGIAQKYNLFPDRIDGSLHPEIRLSRNEVAISIYQLLLNYNSGTMPGTGTPPGTTTPPGRG